MEKKYSSNNPSNHTAHPLSFFSLSEPNLFSHTILSAVVSFSSGLLYLFSPRSSMTSVSPVGFYHSCLVSTLQQWMLLTMLSFWKCPFAFLLCL